MAPRSTSRGEQDFGPAHRGLRLAPGHASARTPPSTGPWPASAAACYRSRIENLLEGRGATVQAGRDRLRRRQAAVRPDLLHAPPRRGHHQRPAQQGRLHATRSRGYIKGLIDIPYSGRGTDSFLGEFSMLLQRTARSVTIPSLEIDQPDCRRAMHSSSVGPIDETQVFYLMSRGLLARTRRARPS